MDDDFRFTIDNIPSEEILGLVEVHNDHQYENGWARLPVSDDPIHVTDVEAILADFEDFCQQALSALKRGPLPLNHDLLGDGVQAALKQRGLVWEVTEGQVELTPRGRGINPSDFQLV